MDDSNDYPGLGGFLRGELVKSLLAKLGVFLNELIFWLLFSLLQGFRVLGFCLISPGYISFILVLDCSLLIALDRVRNSKCFETTISVDSILWFPGYLYLQVLFEHQYSQRLIFWICFSRVNDNVS